MWLKDSVDLTVVTMQPVLLILEPEHVRDIPSILRFNAVLYDLDIEELGKQPEPRQCPELRSLE
jgi:hypothetical protein